MTPELNDKQNRRQRCITVTVYARDDAHWQRLQALEADKLIAAETFDEVVEDWTIDESSRLSEMDPETYRGHEYVPACERDA